MYEIPLTKEPAPKRKKQTKTRVKRRAAGRMKNMKRFSKDSRSLDVNGKRWLKRFQHEHPLKFVLMLKSTFPRLPRMKDSCYMNIQQLPQVASGAQPEGQLPVSVQRTAERIMANPTGVQMEVEDTLRQLRERYRQLQIRLEQSQRARGLPPMDRIVEEQRAPTISRLE